MSETREMAALAAKMMRASKKYLALTRQSAPMVRLSSGEIALALEERRDLLRQMRALDEREADGRRAATIDLAAATRALLSDAPFDATARKCTCPRYAEDGFCAHQQGEKALAALANG